jgi:alkyldihydroxyacetonephosphate synthase
MSVKMIKKDNLTMYFTSFLAERPTLLAQCNKIYAELADIVGPQDITNEPADLLTYRWLPMRQHSLPKGEYLYVLGDFIVYPETTEEVQRIVKLANTHRIPLVVYAGGSGIGITPVYGGIIVDLKKLNRIIKIDEVSQMVTVETGLYIFDLENELNKRGFEMEHLPASFYCACVGGFIGDRSAGRLSTKYGKIEQMVLGMKVVLPTGEVFETPKVPAHAAGPDLNNLVIGAGGTLGIVTEATIKIYPKPEKRIWRSFLFPNLDNGFEAMRKIMQADLNPCLARLYDPIETNSQLFKGILVTKNAIDKIEKKKDSCYLVLGFDGHKKIVDIVDKMAAEICFAHNAEDLGYDEGQFWWDHNLDDYYKGLGRPTRSSEFFPADTPHIGGVFDYVVPMNNFLTVWRETQEALQKKFKKSIIYGHFSHWYKNAAMMYPMIYVWDLPDDPKELSLAFNDAQDIVLRTAMKYGGAFQHHHGVGTIYSKYMPEQWGEAGFKALYTIKKALDPNNIMNPGNLGFEAW